MQYSRRHFLKAAGSGAVVLTTVGGYRSVAGSPALAQSSAGIAPPMTAEIGTFIINGATYQALINDYDEGRRLAMYGPTGGIVSLHELPDFVRLVAENVKVSEQS